MMKNNIIIAKYMGGIFRLYQDIPQIVFNKNKIIAVKYLNYHNDWNKLIKVIQKIKNNSDTYDLKYKDILWSLESLDKKEVYKQVVKYIKNERNYN